MGCDKNGKKVLTLIERYDLWDRKEYIYSDSESNLKQLGDGIPIDNVLSKVTKCPVHNGTCNEYFEIIIHGYNPDLGNKEEKIMMCPLGVSDISKCPLSK